MLVFLINVKKNTHIDFQNIFFFVQTYLSYDLIRGHQTICSILEYMWYRFVGLCQSTTWCEANAGNEGLRNMDRCFFSSWPFVNICRYYYSRIGLPFRHILWYWILLAYVSVLTWWDHDWLVIISSAHLNTLVVDGMISFNVCGGPSRRWH